jgi:HEPN domain-containing protein
MSIGRFRRNIEVASEFLQLAQGDEQVGLLLNESGKHRHAMYFLLQAMEKYVRAKIFTLVDGKNAYFRNRHRDHSIEEALEFFVEIVSLNDDVRKQVREQLDRYVLAGVNFGVLHNDLRYPFYSERFNSYSCLEVTKQDAESLIQRLNFLKRFLQDVDRFR